MRRCRQRILGEIAAERDPEIPDGARIAERAMTRAAAEPVTPHYGVEVVPQLPGEQASRELHGAEHRCGKRQLRTAELGAQKSVIEACVVSHEHRRSRRRLELVEHHPPDVGETRCGADHVIADAGETLDVGGDDALGIDERAPFLEHHPGAQPDRKLRSAAAHFETPRQNALGFDAALRALPHHLPDAQNALAHLFLSRHASPPGLY